eukprot:TRINITY_DN1462_c0_g2_i1.p1 TRINITY_DN1462_c0_g2~~TRINITY_DN1462_c0_g2_i1.p1  ORF type:complete len:353 (-),score=43.20 TRINITY_DN1462_c0_g2_i1:487-1506(-)
MKLPQLLTSSGPQGMETAKLLEVDAPNEEQTKSQVCKVNPLPWPLVTAFDWEVFESKAKAHPPTLYSTPQKPDNCCISCLLWAQRQTCGTCCRSCCMRCGRSCLPLQRFKVTDPDEVFNQMLSVTHPRCPESLKGIWWLEDNVGSEGLVTFQDADWQTESIALKLNTYNWTYDSNGLGGIWLTINAWLFGGRHQFEFSPSGDWINIHIRFGNSHFIYVLKEGDVLKRPDGSLVDFTPGEDLLRVSYSSFDPETAVMYQYLVRRVAYLDSDGRLVKTKAYERLKAVAERSTTSEGIKNIFGQSDPEFRWIEDEQVVAISTPERQGWCSATGAPQQEHMSA